MNEKPPGGRRFLTWALGLFVLALLAIILIGTGEYWSDKREPARSPDTAAPSELRR